VWETDHAEKKGRFTITRSPPRDHSESDSIIVGDTPEAPSPASETDTKLGELERKVDQLNFENQEMRKASITASPNRRENVIHSAKK
jgi:hypothetical protein